MNPELALGAPLWLDVDTGVDDALAIALAVRAGANLIGVSTVAGNVTIDYATDNTRGVLAHVGARDVPVHRGASRPLGAEYRDAAHVHGQVQDGVALGGKQEDIEAGLDEVADRLGGARLDVLVGDAGLDGGQEEGARVDVDRGHAVVAPLGLGGAPAEGVGLA